VSVNFILTSQNAEKETFGHF